MSYSNRRNKAICGHVGVAGLITHNEKKIFHMLLKIDEVRGEDSTGVLAVNTKGDIGIAKSVGTAQDLYDSDEKGEFFDQNGLVRELGLRVLLGHNRFATQGKVDANSAHPFEFENVIGAHNGTMPRHTMSEFVGYTPLGLDSEMLYSELNARKVVMNQDFYWKLQGAMSLVWYNKLDKSHNFLRNEQLPMCVLMNIRKALLFWASEAWLFRALMAKPG